MFFLGYAKAYSKKLVIGLNSDEHIRRHKRPNPIPATARKQALLELGFIDDVIIFDEPDPINFLKLVKPIAHCVGAEYQGDLCIERRYCVEHGIVIIEIPRVGKWSSSVERGMQE
jgi:bifunctional ADP-heptose synthase (sugar kinase/adenylyltransferase)